jgi:hypothetical protein
MRIGRRGIGGRKRVKRRRENREHERLRERDKVYARTPVLYTMYRAVRVNTPLPASTPYSTTSQETPTHTTQSINRRFRASPPFWLEYDI